MTENSISLDLPDDALEEPAATSAAVIVTQVPPEVASEVVNDIIDAELEEEPEDVTEDIETLWDEFHRAVNMTSAELEAWLLTESADPNSEVLPERTAGEVSRSIISVLGKRRTDLTDADVDVMRRVVHVVRAEVGNGGATPPQDDEWRRRLMDLGHDPLKPPLDEGTWGSRTDLRNTA